MILARAAAGSAVFFLAAPGVVAGLAPWALTGWVVPHDPSVSLVVRSIVAGALVLPGLAVLVSSFVRFVREGAGTPAPVAPTEHLVLGGGYRYVRNPMYVAVVTILLGQCVLFGSAALLIYTIAVWAAMAAFVRFYEEPLLAGRFGAAYEEYRAHVRGWLPRLRPWTPGNER